MERRSTPPEALREVPVVIKRKRDQGVVFEHDVNDEAPEPEFDYDSDEIEVPDLTEYEAADLQDPDDQDPDGHGNANTPGVLFEAIPKQLHVASKSLNGSNA